VAAQNRVGIDIVSTDKAGLDKLTAAYRAHGKAMGQAIADGLGIADRATEQTERKTRDAGTKMSSAMRGTVSSMTRELDKLERAAALSGDGMSSEYAAALTVVRGDLKAIVDAGSKTGASLEGDLGDALRSVEKDLGKLRPATTQVDRAFSEMGRNATRILDRIEIEAADAGGELGDSMGRAARSMRADLERVQAEGRETGASLDSDIGRALRNIQADARRTKAELEDALKPPQGAGGGGLGDLLGDSMSGGFDLGGLIEGGLGKLGAGGGALAGAGAAAGAAYAAAMVDAFTKYWANDKIGGLIAAQQGGSVGEAHRLGRIVGEAYYSGIADSVEESGAALSGVLSQGLVDTSASETELRELTNMASTAAKVVGEDAGRIARAAKQLLVNGLADSAGQAIDIITTASQKGVNVSGDLLDTIEEYAPMFRDLGLTGEQSLGLVSQALQAGARNSDIAADALKEFNIRAKDGSEATARGFRTIGLDAGKMGADIAAGGDRARGALDLTLDRLRAIEDPVVRSQAAVDLFGTKAEDLGDALFGMDLDTVRDQFGNVAGATQEAQDVISQTEPPTDKLARGFDKMTNSTLGAMFAVMGLNGAVGEGKWEKNNPKIIEFNEATDGSAGSMDGAAGSANNYVESIEELISAQREAATGVIDFNDAQIAAQKAITEASDAAKEFAGKGLNEAKTGFDLTTEAGQELSSKLLDVADSTLKTAEAMDQQGKSQQEIQTYIEGSRTKFLELADQMGLSADAAGVLADQLFGIPLERKTRATFDDAGARARIRLYQIAADIATRGRRTEVVANTANAVARMRILQIAAEIATRDRVMNIIVRQSTGGLLGWGPGNKETGGIASGVWGAQSGGQRHGSTVINEAGPEVVELPTGSKVMTAGATRAMGEAGLLGGGGGGPIHLTLSLDGSDRLGRALLESIRVEVDTRYGGNVQRAMGRGAAA
jgi:phage-related minor tail protein